MYSKAIESPVQTGKDTELEEFPAPGGTVKAPYKAPFIYTFTKGAGLPPHPLLFKSNISNPLVFNLSGILDIRLKKFNEAINKFKKAITLDSEFAEAYFNLGNLSHNLGQLNEAENYLINATKYKQNYVRAIYVLGDNYYLQDKIELAIKSYLNILDIQPENNDVFVKVLDILTFYKNDIKIDDDIINANYAIEKINHKIDLHNNIHDDQIKIIYKDIL